jgi:hypothetical protein
MANSYLLIIGDREALAWVLRESRMAFSRRGAREAAELRIGDRLFLYTTRGCFHNPTHDRGRVIGEAQVASEVEKLDDPIVIAGRTFTAGCALEVRSLAPLRSGVELGPLVPKLRAFPSNDGWGARLRRTLVALPTRDVRVIQRQLSRHARPVQEVQQAYLE